MQFRLDSNIVVGLAFVGVLVGHYRARKGAAVRRVDVSFKNLPEELVGFKIVQISDLHISKYIGRNYVEQVVQLANAEIANMVALTGDIGDGTYTELKNDAEPLIQLIPRGKVFFITGNHEYYHGVSEWEAAFEKMGMTVLRNENRIVEHNGRKILVGGVVDGAIKIIDQNKNPDPSQAAKSDLHPSEISFRILLAHNPKLAALGDAAKFDLQLSGHTHAGQFLPWTIVTKMVHAPHYWGLSRQGNMQVYVSAGTGTWGPPIRLGTTPELTVITLIRNQN